MCDTDFAQSDDVSIVGWKDRGNKPIILHNIFVIEIVLKTNARRERTTILCPSSIADYNRHMGAVNCLNWSVLYKPINLTNVLLKFLENIWFI